jgi:O-antigen ligase
MIWSVIIILLFMIPLFPVELFRISPVFLCSGFSLLLISSPRYRLNRADVDKAVILPLFAFMITAFLTSVFSQNIALSLYHTAYLTSCVVLFIFFSLLDKIKQRQAVTALVISSCAVSLIGIAQRFFYFDRILCSVIGRFHAFTSSEFFYVMYIVTKYRIVSMFNNPNLLASYLIMVNLILFALMAEYLEKKRAGILSVLFCVFALNTLSLRLTGSMSGFISFVLGTAVFFFLLFIAYPQLVKKYKWYFASLSVLIVICLCQLCLARYNSHEPGYNLFTTISNRMEFWKTAWAFISDKPFGFVGLGNFKALYSMYAPSTAVTTIMAHNMMLQLWVETGLYGLLTFACFVAVMISSALKNLIKKPDILRIGLFSAVFAFLLHNLIDFSFFVPQVSAIWWAVAGILTTTVRNNE